MLKGQKDIFEKQSTHSLVKKYNIQPLPNPIQPEELFIPQILAEVWSPQNSFYTHPPNKLYKNQTFNLLMN